MRVTDAVLNELKAREGEFVSGEELGKRCGASRNAVWCAVRRLRETGIEIRALPRRGYCYRSGEHELTEAKIRVHLSDPSRFRIRVVSRIDSTNLAVKQAAESGEASGFALFAESQSAGRGRENRSFYSPAGTGLYFSVLLRPEIEASAALTVTVAAAVATARAIEEEFGVSVGIKWVNDLYVGGKKVCGILTEGSVDCETGRLRYAVCGIGVNLTEPNGGFPSELRSVAGGIGDRCNGEIRARLAARILEYFSEALDDGENVISEYRARSVLIGRDVVSVNGAFCGAARVLGVDDAAGLVVRLASGEVRTLQSGEVRVRSVNPIG